MKSTALTILIVFIAAAVNAATLKTEITTKLFEGVKLVKSVILQNDDSSESVMSIVTYGLRKKAVFGLVPVNVYVLQFLAAKPEKLVKTEAGFLASLKEAGPIQLHLTFLRNLPGEKITESFEDGLGANKINIKNLSPELTQILSEVSNIIEFKEGENFSITVNWTSNTAVAYLANTGSSTTPEIKIITGQKDFADQLLSIWFGKVTDSKLNDLKKTLIN